MRISEAEKKDLYDKMVRMADETLRDRDFGRFSFIIDLKDGVPVKLSEVIELKTYTRVNHNLRVEK